MGLKKIASFVVAMILILGIVPEAMAEYSVLTYGRISVAMPQITAEINGSGYDLSSVSAILGSEKLNVEDAHTYDNSKDSTCVYVLVDLSTSMWSSFELVKNNITKYTKQMGDNDKLVLITFGENEVNVPLSGNETKDEIIEVINNLECNEDGTLFYEALSKAYQLSNSSISSYDREYVLAFSDGIDIQMGNVTYDEITAQYATHNLPIYAACSSNSSKDASDIFGKLARSSGGYFSIITDESEFDKLLKEIRDVTLLKLTAQNNFADGQSRQLSVKIDNLQVEYIIPVARSIPDTTPPSLGDVHYDAESGSIIVSFSESVLGALSSGAYKITDDNGNVFAVTSVTASGNAENTVELTTKGEIHNGSYTVSVNGITDASQERNALAAEAEFTVDNAKSNTLPIWSIVLIVALAVVVLFAVILIVVIVSRKKKNNAVDDSSVVDTKATGVISEYTAIQPEQIKHHIKTNDPIRICLKIKTGRFNEQIVDTGIVSSLIVGRSDTCDIYIDDTKLSRQHFAIENDGGKFYIMDLQSKNGTLLNGIRVIGRQRLNSGDKILAGLSEILFTALGR